MTVREAIINFPAQLAYEPVIENGPLKKPYKNYIVAGMGGSALSASFLKSWDPGLHPAITVHRDYGLPGETDKLENALIIASSYSGNTEETVDAFLEARKRNLDVAVIAIGGKLIELAKTENVPYVQLPDTHIQPRSALGLNAKALLKLIGREDAIQELAKLSNTINPLALEVPGKTLAEEFKNHIPIIYSSARHNTALGYIWKITLNETGKIPAFVNVLPELNHNEMNSFDGAADTRHLTDHFAFIILKDPLDDPRLQKRMSLLEKFYRDRGFLVKTLDLTGETAFEKMFSSFLLADWTALYTAELYNRDPNGIPMVEEFKKLMAE
jgi:glucose/mannose-6-phosphate isomerase